MLSTVIKYFVLDLTALLQSQVTLFIKSLHITWEVTLYGIKLHSIANTVDVSVLGVSLNQSYLWIDGVIKLGISLSQVYH
jgi:hypothetical protein